VKAARGLLILIQFEELSGQRGFIIKSYCSRQECSPPLVLVTAESKHPGNTNCCKFLIVFQKDLISFNFSTELWRVFCQRRTGDTA